MKDATNVHGLAFFLNPFWRKFVGRKIVVVSLSEPEHRMRDARALMALRQFLPPEESGITTYRTVTIGGRETPHWPEEIAASPNSGLIIVGRPSLFGEEALNLIAGCEPGFAYSFKRNDCPDQQLQTRRDYRAVIAPLAVHRRFQSELFDESQRRQPRPSKLKDLGLVYSGWCESRPVAVFGGSSTVSTWGCAVWSMQSPGRDDLRWYQDIQGVIEASVVNTPRAFQTVHAEVHDGQILTPVSIWMDGPDLPPPDGWKEAISRQGADSARIRILANGSTVFRPQGYMIPLVLIAWMNLGREERRAALLRATCTTADVLGWIDAFLGRTDAMGSRANVQSWVNGILNDAVRYLNEVGGLATIEGNRPSRFTLWFRELPRFLPVFRV